MKNHSLKNLEYNKIKEILTSFAKTFDGKRKIENLSPEKDYKIVDKELKKVSELKKIIQIKGNLPIIELKENKCLNKIDKTLCLLSEEILYIKNILYISKQLKDYFSPFQDSEYPNIFFFWKGINILTDLQNRITNTIDENGEILDSASPALVQIRNNIFHCSNEIKKLLTDLFHSKSFSSSIQDTIITIRNKRFVIPIKQECRKNIQGVIQDESGSRATVFIEPFEIVEKNNQMQDLFYQEKKEINNILCALTKEIKNKKDILINNYNIIITFDIINAKALFSLEINAREPELNSSGIVKIIDGKHPLLLFNKECTPIPVSISIGADFNVLVISGANAGGKTAALKMIGLAILMTQSGLHFPCNDGTTIAVFDQLWALIGDEQSLEKNLSTFSSHLLFIKEILENISVNSIVLIDEICADTDPEVGSYLAFCIIKYLGEKKIRVIATTHFNSLKMMVLSERGMLNASVNFDKTTFLPTYQITMGNAGESMTLFLAERIGIPEFIINEVKRYSVHKEDFFELLAKAQKALEDEKFELEKERKHLSDIYSLEKEKLSILQKEIDMYQIKYKQEFKLLVKELRHKLQNIISNEQAVKSASYSEVKKSFEKIADEYDKKIKKDLSPFIELKKNNLTFEEVQIGEKIKISNSNQIGEVISKDEKQGTIKLSVNNFKIVVYPSDLEKTLPPLKTNKEPAPVSITFDEDDNIGNKLNIIGLTGDEAREKVISFLNKAYIRKINPLEIVHGHGQRILRKIVKKILTELPFIDSFHHPEINEGGTGVTIVNLIIGTKNDL